jgi:methylated-DNA-[protein]-cysteine S-methyltransferase
VIRYPAEGWGVGEIVVEGELLLHAELPRPRSGTVPERGLSPLADRLASYFDGATNDFADVELDLDDATPFQRAVTDTLRAVPYGETVTYGELAALAGHPGAQRAVGTFCARNRFGVVVPCHRVVAADGIGPYGSLGTAYKRRLLELEHAAL